MYYELSSQIGPSRRSLSCLTKGLDNPLSPSPPVPDLFQLLVTPITNSNIYI